MRAFLMTGSLIEAGSEEEEFGKRCREGSELGRRLLRPSPRAGKLMTRQE